MTNQQITEAADEFARNNRTRIASEIVDTKIYLPESRPMTVFMAGSPGAGKTEISRAVVESLQCESAESGSEARRILRIDPDDFRRFFSDYNGSNSSLFNSAVTKVLERVVDRAFEKKISFLLDGTLSSESVSDRNIDRALRKERSVRVIYVYQKPTRAWQFVLSREVLEGRNIPIDGFVSQFFAARRNVRRIKETYGNSVTVDIVVQAANEEDDEFAAEDVSADQIDELVTVEYDERQLLDLLRARQP